MTDQVRSIEEQVQLLLTVLRGPAQKTPELMMKLVGWIKDLPPSGLTPELVSTFCSAFKLQEHVFRDLVAPITRVSPDFERLVPAEGWLHDYVEYTRNTEPPTAFHYFAGLVAIGATMARNSYYDMGAFSIFPNLCVIIVAPTGKCRKTSACNVAVGLLRSVEACKILADKLTPEALVSSFENETTSTGLIYAPELAVFLGKQKYQEGMIPLLTALFDAPDEWSSKTIMRGEVHLYNVAFSMLGCSTLDWIQTAIPKDVFGGGFMSRLLFVVQNETPRCFPIPPPFDTEMKKRLLRKLLEIQKISGQWTMTPEAVKWFDTWYRHRSDAGTENRQFAGYYERKPVHLIRIAICLAASYGYNLVLEPKVLKEALLILDWMESFLPRTFETMQQGQIGEDQERILQQLKKSKGAVDHSTLLRMNSKRLDARKFRDVLDTLREAKLVRWDNNSKTYFLTQEGWK